MVLMLIIWYLLAREMNAMEYPYDNNNYQSPTASSSNDATQKLHHKLSSRFNKITVQEFEDLLNEGADLYQTNNDGQTALHIIIHRAISNGNCDLITLCCKKNVDWHFKYSDISPYELSKAATQFRRVNGIKYAQEVFNKIEAHQKKLNAQGSNAHD